MFSSELSSVKLFLFQGVQCISEFSVAVAHILIDSQERHHQASKRNPVNLFRTLKGTRRRPPTSNIKFICCVFLLGLYYIVSREVDRCRLSENTTAFQYTFFHRKVESARDVCLHCWIFLESQFHVEMQRTPSHEM